MKRLSVLLLIAPLALAGCITDPVTGRSTIGVPISDAEEAQMGISYQPQIVQQYGGEYPDATLHAYLDPIVLGMARRSERPNMPWEFTVLNSSVPNAFAVPGGKVFVTRGLLAEFEDEAEFAVVMGHEIGHVEHRHAARSMGRDLLLQGTVGIGTTLIDDTRVGDLLSGGLGLLRLRYGRDDERESDVRGVRHSYDAGYDPREGADVFRTFKRLKEEQGGGGGGLLDAWTSSHPLDDERIANIQVLAAEVDPRLAGSGPVSGLTVTTERFGSLMAQVRSVHAVYLRHDAALAKAQAAAQAKDTKALARLLPEFEAAAAALPGHAAPLQTQGLLLVTLGDGARARQVLERASAMGQGLVVTELALSHLCLDGGDTGAAIRHASQGLELLPGYYPCHFVRAEALHAAGRDGDARADYDAVMQAAPQDSEAYRISAERLGQAPAGGAKKRRQ